ncbi:Histone-lysine N-methyltransferase EHMT2 [Cytospora mali]|uniref:Histone-lysine N-methyltransferase EHMT2 n=1 Tax=Cytospora mali TaxID=578113 RepID=A0A194US81_CYTMA|nr:Histone-lysine N-methyltransferase EHMT2 [Valsa mali var. pyri (nom. inval.)]
MENGKSFTSVNSNDRTKKVISGRVGKPKPQRITTHRYDPKDWERTTNSLKGIYTRAEGDEPINSSGRPRRSRRRGQEPEIAVEDLLKTGVPRCLRDFRGRDAHERGLVEIRDTGKANIGYGVFVRPMATISSGQILGEYIGELLPANDDSMSDYRFDINLFVAIDSQTYGNWTRFMNHHCDLNVDSIRTQVGGRAAIVFRANRDIGPNEEVLIYYGERYFNEARMQCRCSVSKKPHKPRQVGK